MKKFLPHIVTTILLFCGLFVLTQVIETRVWYLGFAADSGAVVNDHKTTIQLMIFVLGLSIWLAISNLSVTGISGFSSIRSKIMLNALTIITIYLTNYFLSKVIDSGGFNIYFDWRNNLGFPLAIITWIFSTFLTLTIQLFKEIVIVGLIKNK